MGIIADLNKSVVSICRYRVTAYSLVARPCPLLFKYDCRSCTEMHFPVTGTAGWCMDTVLAFLTGETGSRLGQPMAIAIPRYIQLSATTVSSVSVHS